jgi:tetratricopeptide (TPR) repeat protein
MQHTRLHCAVILAIAAVSMSLSTSAIGAAPPKDDSDFYPGSSLGSYLAGGLARGLNDTRSAVQFYRRALAQEPNNRRILEHAFLMEATEGNADEAHALARRLVKLDKTHRFARMWLGLAAFKRKHYRLADHHFAAASSGPIGELTSALARAWTAAAAGHTTKAIKFTRFTHRANWARYYLRYHRALLADYAGRNKLARENYQALFALDSRTPRITMAYLRFAARIGDISLANQILQRNMQSSGGQLHPIVEAIARRLQQRRPIKPLIQSAREGLAEVFYGLGDALTTEGGNSVGIIYLQMALDLRPNFSHALAGLANAYENTKQYQRAIDIYQKIDVASPLRLLIDIRRASNLDELGRVDEAKTVLLGLLRRETHAQDQTAPGAGGSTEQPTLADLRAVTVPDETLHQGQSGEATAQLQNVLHVLGFYAGPRNGKFGPQTQNAVRGFQRSVGLRGDGVVGPETRARLQQALGSAVAREREHLALGDASSRQRVLREATARVRIYNAIAGLLRRHKRFAESIEYYSKIIAEIKQPRKRDWTYWYARGTSYERINKWAEAERDLLKAMELHPDQPLILNYLGYSWVDQNKHLDRGLELITRAVQLKPDDGYIVDSLGWAYYRLGRYTEAVQHLEQAVELRPSDPILNDHLGDALWRVDRKREARFQWQLALTLKPEKKSIEAIRKKLLVGLPDETDKPAIGLPKAKQAPHGLGKRASQSVIERK